MQPLILSALSKKLPKDSYKIIKSIDALPTPETPLLQISSYETLSFEHLMSHGTTSLANAYMIRKALIRKHYLSTTAHNWITKHPDSILKKSIKPSCDFELDYAEFLDDALVEAWELQESFQRNADKEADEREWWILKPGMSDRGQGIRLFSTEEELQTIFEEWEAERPDSDDEGENEDEDEDGKDEGSGGDYIMTSHLRHFIAQAYIHPPLLLPSNPRKFHIRTYVLAFGSLKVYVYKHMLALFAPEPYVAPWKSESEDGSIDLKSHLTNTCLQDGTRDGAVRSFWDLQELPTGDWKDAAFDQICGITGDIFEAAAKGMMIHFQTSPNAFEVFGLDFMLDEAGQAYLLEVNAFPDFKQTGDDLKAVVQRLWEGVVGVGVSKFFGVEGQGTDEDMVLVKDLDLGRR